jgi:pyruvate/2-oxoacid:ferredoxin oxidoreductase alpha subunit
MKIRFLRPLPVKRWQEALGRAEKVIVIDRNLIAGAGGVFAGEVRSVLYDLPRRPTVYPVVAGLGGRDVTAQDVEGIVRQILSDDQPNDETLFWGLKQ